MKVIVSSDFHGHLPEIEEKFDLFLICGDICPAYNHNIVFQRDWVENIFTKWVKDLNFNGENSKVVMVPGNHDFIFESMDQFWYDELNRATDGRLTVLNNTEYNFEYKDGEVEKSLKIFGTPYCKEFFNWAFMRPTNVLKRLYSEIPEDTDILMCHDSAMIEEYGTIHQGRSKGLDAGNKVLADAIEEKKPKMAFYGHIHSQDHTFKKVGETWMAGVSYIDESYTPAYDLLTFDYNNDKIENIDGIQASV